MHKNRCSCSPKDPSSPFLKLLVFLILSAIIGLLGCQEQATDITKPVYDKGNPRLSSQLNDLVKANAAGQAASFAAQSQIELVDQRVRVIVEVLPGQMAAVTSAAGKLGVVETSYNDLLQVLLPVSSLEVLANEPGVRLIRLPLPAVPAASGNEVK